MINLEFNTKVSKEEKMKKYIIIMLSILLLVGCNGKENDKLKVSVSIVPEELMVKKVAGDLVDVYTLIPPGNSPANYQPSPKLIEDFQNSSIYFTIDVPAEKNILESLGKSTEVVDLADIVDGKYEARFFTADKKDNHESHNHIGRDPHIWLSIKRTIVMTETIKEHLIRVDAENKEIYEKNAEEFITYLKNLDQEIKEKVQMVDNKSFIIYHPSYGYFADDYGLTMYEIEKEGKEATIKDLGNIVEFAKENKINKIFYQQEFDSEQAKIIADEIDGDTFKLRPLSLDYLENLKEMIEVLRK